LPSTWFAGTVELASDRAHGGEFETVLDVLEEGMNWGARIAWFSVVLCFGSCIGYAIAGDHRRALYYFFAACITATVTYQ